MKQPTILSFDCLRLLHKVTTTANKQIFFSDDDHDGG
jgi:hypothetical protein